MKMKMTMKMTRERKIKPPFFLVAVSVMLMIVWFDTSCRTKAHEIDSHRLNSLNDETIRKEMSSSHTHREEKKTSQQQNVLGSALEECCSCPMTGFFRNGFCEVASADYGVHAVCAVVTQDFLDFTRSRGNDLSTPRGSSFPGLKPGDKWCLCAGRWKEAMVHGVAPPVVLKSTNIAALNVVSLDDLKRFALDLDLDQPLL